MRLMTIKQMYANGIITNTNPFIFIIIWDVIAVGSKHS